MSDIDLSHVSIDAWVCVGEALIDGGGVPVSLSDLCKGVAKDRSALGTRKVDIKEAGGVEPLTDAILDVLTRAAVVEASDGGYCITDAYMTSCGLPGGGVELRVYEGKRTSWIDIYPKEERERKRIEERNRNAAGDAIRLGAIAVRAGLRSVAPADEDNRTKALYQSLKEFGYIDAFPIAISSKGEIVDGRHRLEYAQQIRDELIADGSDDEAKIKSLDSDRIIRTAKIVDGDSDQVETAVASDARIPWNAPERRKLLADGSKSTADLAALLGESQRTIRRWRQEATQDMKVLRDREILRLAPYKTQTEIAKLVGCSQKTVSAVLSKNGQMAKTTKTVEEKLSDVEQHLSMDNADLLWFKDRWLIVAEPGVIAVYERKVLLAWHDDAWDGDQYFLQGMPEPIERGSFSR
jgi:hypothetical protein